MSHAYDNKIDNRIIFLLKFRKCISTSSIFQYFFIISKYLSIFMLSHDLKVHSGNYINSFFGYLTLTKVFEIDGDNSPIIISLFLILFASIFFYINLRSFYFKIKNKDDPLADSNTKKYFIPIFSLFIFIFVLLNQTLYEVLFSFFLCKGKVSIATGAVSLDYSCYSAFRYFLMFISIALIAILTTINIIFNYVYFQPWFNSDCIIPTIFNGNNLIWVILPLLQGYVTLEHNIPDDYALIIRYLIRGIFILYTLHFYFQVNKFIYISKNAHYLIIFMNTFNFISILIEFIPYVNNQLTDINFVIIKILFEFTITCIVLYFISRSLDKSVLNGFTNWKSSGFFYELFSRYLYLLVNFNEDNNETELKKLIKNFLDKKLVNASGESNTDYNIEIEDRIEENKNLDKVYSNALSFFRVIKNANEVKDVFNGTKNKSTLRREAKLRDVLKKSKYKLILTKLEFYVDELEEILTHSIMDEKSNEVNKFKNIIIYCLFCSLVKRNFISAFFFLEKVLQMKIYKNNFLMKLYYAQIKKLICKLHYGNRVKESKEKSSLKKFFDNIKVFDNLFENLKNSVEALKYMTLKINSDNVNLIDLTETMSDTWDKLSATSLGKNKNLKEVFNTLNNTMENNALISKYVIFNDLVFDDNEVKETELFEAIDLKMGTENVNDNFMILYLDENEDIYIMKVENKLQAMLGYENTDLTGTNLLTLLPPTIAKLHKQKTTAFTGSNQDYRKLDLFFITKQKYNLPFSATLVIFPMFNNRILFFCMCEVFNKNVDLNTFELTKLPSFSFSCFVELSNLLEIVTTNKEFEKVFGINREVINFPTGKFNFLNQVLKISADSIFNRYDHLQHYTVRIPFVTIFDNIKKIDYEEFREYALESYYKLKNFFTNYNLSKHKNAVMCIFLERRIINHVDNDFMMTVNMTRELDRKMPKSMVNGNTTRSTMIRESFIENNMDKFYPEKLNKEKKVGMLIKEITLMSHNMLEEGGRLWDGAVKYSEITEFTSEAKVLGAFAIDKPQDQNAKPNAKNSSDNQNETNISLTSNTSHFKIQHFIFFLILSLCLIAYFAVFFGYIIKSYSTVLNIYELNTNILLIKYSQVMAVFLITETFIKKNKMFPMTNTQDLINNPNDLDSYILDLNDNVYQFQQTFSLLLSDSSYDSQSISLLVNKAMVYKSIVTDFSIYWRNFTFYDSIDIFRLRVENYDFFNPLTFSNNPSDFTSAGLTFDLNKKNILGKLTSQGDLLIYYLVNNFIDKTIPLCDNILTENSKILVSFTDNLIKLELVFFIVLFIWLIVFFIYLYSFFYSGKKYIYERYFILCNIIKYFTPYLHQKFKSYEEIVVNYSNENYNYFSKLDFDVDIELINSSLIRFEKEGNNMLVYSGSTKGKILFQKKSLFCENNTSAIIKSARDKRKTIVMAQNQDGTFCINTAEVLKSSPGLIQSKNFETKKPSFKFEEELAFNNSLNNLPYGYARQETSSTNKKLLPSPMTSKSNLLSASVDLTKRKGLLSSYREEEVNEVNEVMLNPKNLLRSKISFYFDFYFLLTIIILFFLLNLIFFIIILNYSSKVVSIGKFTTMVSDLSYSQIEISLIYLITLLRGSEITAESSKTPIFQEKIQNFITDTKSIFVSNNLLTYVNNYELTLYNNGACQSILSTYDTFLNLPASDVNSCQNIAGGIYKNGLILGFQSTVNNLDNIYNEKAKTTFKINANGTTTYYDDNLNTVFVTRKDVIEKNIYNTRQIIKSDTDSIFTSSKNSLNLYYVLFFLMFMLLVLSYCFIYLFTQRSYELLTRMEKVIINLLK